MFKRNNNFIRKGNNYNNINKQDLIEKTVLTVFFFDAINRRRAIITKTKNGVKLLFYDIFYQIKENCR